jgi:hypothetical protein
MRSFVCRLAIAIAVLLLPALGQAWGTIGHSVVGALAEARLTPEARAAVADLLADEPDPTLPGIANWADQVRASRPDYAWSVPLHFVNFKPGHCRFGEDAECADGVCVVGAIERYRHEMADASLPRERRAMALKFVVHFVGDIHQPLHAGDAADRGGNLLQISYRGEGWNLHRVWDALLIQSLDLDWPAYAQRLQATPAERSLSRALSVTEPERWAEESCRITRRRGFYPQRHRIQDNYLESKRPLADQRLRLAGARLAQVLNEAFRKE